MIQNGVHDIQIKYKSHYQCTVKNDKYVIQNGVNDIQIKYKGHYQCTVKNDKYVIQNGVNDIQINRNQINQSVHRYGLDPQTGLNYTLIE